MHSLAKFTSLIYEELLQMIGKKLTTPKQDFPDSRMVKILPCNVGGVGLIPCWAAKIPCALWPRKKNIKQKQNYNKFNKDFKNSPH